MDFYELEEGATIELGAKANYDGRPADGEYKVPSEEDSTVVLTYVFENGVLTEIKEPEVVVEEEPEDEALTCTTRRKRSFKGEH